MKRLLIFSAIALAAALVAIAGAIWLSGSHGRKALHSLQGTCEARIVIQFENDDPAVFDGSLHCGGPDPQTYARMLSSSKISERTMATFSPDELRRIFGNNFFQTGLTPFSGVHVETSRDDRQLLSISSNHSDPVAARLVVERLYSEVIRTQRDFHLDANEDAMRLLRDKRAELIARTQKAETQMNEAQHSHVSAAMRDAEIAFATSRELLRNIEDRLATSAASAKIVPPLPFHVTEARVTSGPFWNRTKTDFTSEVARMEGDSKGSWVDS